MESKIILFQNKNILEIFFIKIFMHIFEYISCIIFELFCLITNEKGNFFMKQGRIKKNINRIKILVSENSFDRR